MPKKKAATAGTKKKVAKKVNKKKNSGQIKKKAAKKTARKVATKGKRVMPKPTSKKAKGWASGTVGSILSAKNPRSELERQTPAWLKKLRIAEKESLDRISIDRYRAEQVLKARRDELMQLPDVNGLHVGYRRRKGKISYPLEICIRIHVDTKYPNPKDGRIVSSFPDQFDGVPVDILCRRYEIIAGPRDPANRVADPASTTNLPPTRRFDPLRGGIAIANANNVENWGTLGLPVFRNGELVLLTNAHVALSGSSTFPQPVLHPPIVGGPVVGELTSGSSSFSIRDESMDAAFITIKGASAKVKLFGPDRDFTNLPLRIGYASNSQEVFIIGAASELNGGVGRIQTIHGTVDIRGFKTMKNQIIATPNDPAIPMLIPGDSGSVLLAFSDATETSLDVVGLVHAKGDDGALIATPIQRIQELFRFTLF